MKKEPKKLIRSIIKEELVELTGDYKLAIVLNQMIYWSQRVKDFDEFIQEEKERYEKFSGQALIYNETNGWIYKKAEQLANETLMRVKPKAMRIYLQALVDKGWLSQRRNPYLQLDRTLQYRVNISKIQSDLLKLGYTLEGYSFDLSNFPKENTTVEKENTKGEKENSIFQNDPCIFQNDQTIPEIITETNTEIIPEIKNSENSFATNVASEKPKRNLSKKSKKKTEEPDSRANELAKYIFSNHPVKPFVMEWSTLTKMMKNLLKSFDNAGFNGTAVSTIKKRFDNFCKSNFPKENDFGIQLFLSTHNQYESGPKNGKPAHFNPAAIPIQHTTKRKYITSKDMPLEDLIPKEQNIDDIEIDF